MFLALRFCALLAFTLFSTRLFGQTAPQTENASTTLSIKRLTTTAPGTAIEVRLKGQDAAGSLSVAADGKVVISDDLLKKKKPFELRVLSGPISTNWIPLPATSRNLVIYTHVEAEENVGIATVQTVGEPTPRQLIAPLFDGQADTTQRKPFPITLTDSSGFVMAGIRPTAPVNYNDILKIIGYPPRAREIGQEGVVIVEAYVDKDGPIANWKVVRADGEYLREAVTAVIPKIIMKVGTAGGWEFPCFLLIPYNFILR